ncbi:hypothetical protein [Brucella intermedia]|uniref:hypothetical protein n=1 Tax=Brucella intermedia TaxID=94625 RepID=UPI00124DAC5A|nr:hypothetical protein [Brucella intermedia]KAB2692412.1 hypothetical protein F9K72_21360 [Brucella intermedia]
MEIISTEVCKTVCGSGTEGLLIGAGVGGMVGSTVGPVGMVAGAVIGGALGHAIEELHNTVQAS